ncbi:obscurin-like isoform X4 [Anguilla rostrata]|uniref:obscurin-like isoform X4 n=1 Tax=Anguilla rostrata TaxID=7938 RepID=UPI0030D29C70
MSLKKISISLDSFVQKQTLHISIERQFGSVQLNLLCVYSVGKLTLKTMLVCIWLVSSLIHMISGCSLSASTEVTGYTRGSVVLPCYCTERQPTPNDGRWVFSSHGSDITLWPYPNTVNDRFKDRVIISDTPGNLSLSLSGLTLPDGGTYSCEADGQHRDISLTVKGCVLSNSEPINITGFTGDSVVLPCACTDVQKKPEQIKWTAHKGGQSTVIFPPSVNDRYKHRVQVLDSVSPGNLSLRLSNLTLSDGGTYMCEADGNYLDISLTVKEGCVLSDSEPIHMTGFTGDSVVLPCACTDVQKKPELVKWIAYPGGQSTVIFPQSPPGVNDRYKHKVQVLDSISPGNLSLRLSDLTLSDGGSYRCEADGNYRNISLTVEGCVLSGSKPIDITGFTGDSVVLPCACTNVQRKPEWVKWTVHPGGQSTVIFPPSVNDSYKHRVQVLDSVSPGNLSLRLSDLTLSDGGRYRCEADGHYRDISLTVKGCSLSASTEVTGYTRGSVVLPCYCTKGQPTPTSTRWVFSSRGSDITLWSYPNTVNDRFKDRVIISDTPGNLSLSLSGLTRSDGGTYNCEADGQHRNIRLTVKGCSLSAPKEVTGYTGGFVVLPCYCTEGQPTPNTARWSFLQDPSSIILWSYPNEVDDQYKDRVIISDTPGNLSLRLSVLTLSDKGFYRCETDGHFRDIFLTVKGCSLSAPKEVTGYTGGSVLLPCYCTEGQPTPNTARWIFLHDHSNIELWSYPNTVNDQYQDRVIISDTPGNLSLRLSDLTLSDKGFYRCEASTAIDRDIRLKVKGCSLSAPKQVTGYTGGSVVLPCYCTEGQPTLKSARWIFNPGPSDTTLWSYPNAVNNRYKDRVNISATPGNLTLRLSDLTPADGGTYRCEASRTIYRDISLRVKGATTRSPAITEHVSTRGSKPPSTTEIHLKKSILYATIAAVVATVAVCGAVLFYHRVRSRKNAHVESREEQEMRTREQVEEKNADSVTYSTVVHSKTVKNTNIQNQSENSTEYASIKLGMISYL